MAMRLRPSLRPTDALEVLDHVELLEFPYFEARTRSRFMSDPYAISLSQIGKKAPVTLFRVTHAMHGDTARLAKGTIGSQELRLDAESGIRNVLSFGRALLEPTVYCDFDLRTVELPDADNELGLAAAGVYEYLCGESTEADIRN